MTDPVYSVNILIAIGMISVMGIVYYILRNSYIELKKGGMTPPFG